MKAPRFKPLIALLAVLATPLMVFAEDPVSVFLGNPVSTTNSSLSASDNWDPSGVPTNADWKTDNSLRVLRFSQARVTVNLSFANYSHETTDPTNNPYFEFVVAAGSDVDLNFESVALTTGAIPFRLTNNTASADLLISGGLTVNSAMHIGRETAAATSSVSSFGDVSVAGTTSIGAGGLVSLSRTLGTVNLGNVEMAGGSIYLTTGSGANGTSTSVENTITVNRLHGSSGTIQGNKDLTSGQLVVDGTTDGTFSGTIVDGLGVIRLTKDGSSTLTLEGENTYSGVTTVLGGELSLGVAGSIAGSAAFDVRAGGTLSTNGTLSLPDAVTIGIDGGSGQIVANTLTIGGDLTIDTIGSYGAEQWLVFDFTSASGSFDSVALTGSYAGTLSLDDSIWSATIDGQDWTFDQSTGMLSVIPEPRTAAIALASVALVIAIRRKLKR